MLLAVCTACKTDASYLVSEYLNDLARSSGIGEGKDTDDSFEKLYQWGVVSLEEKELMEQPLNYEFLSMTLGKLVAYEGDYFAYLKGNDLISANVKASTFLDKQKADQLIEKAVSMINQKEFDECYEYDHTQTVKYSEDDLLPGDLYYEDETYYIVQESGDLREAQLEEIYEYLNLSDTYEIDFTQAQIIPYNEEETTSYINHNYQLLASNNHVFNSDGFRISYTLNRSGIDVHVSKDFNGFNLFADLSIYNVKPSYSWTYREGDLKNCYFSVKMDSTEEIGISDGKYGDYYLKFKDLDSSSFLSLLDSIIDPISDQVEASIPICKIKTPLPNIPSAYLNLDLLIKLYASGKAELIMTNSHLMGFETKNGQIRFINEHSGDLDAIPSASAKAAFGINLNLEAAKLCLADIELDSGIRSIVKATMHLYDSEGNQDVIDSDVSYAALNEISKENTDVKICGDVSLYWMMNLILNTSKTKMYQLGFSKTFEILDEDNQIFGNLHHFENGHFVEKCTRKDKVSIKSMEEIDADKILLDSYSKVMMVNDVYQILIKGLPASYRYADLVYESSDQTVAEVSSGYVKAIKPGNAQITISTSDKKYQAYMNILVSTG